MLEIRNVCRSPMMRFLQWSTLACLCLGAVALSALRAPAQHSKAQSGGSAVTAREEAASSVEGNADSAAQGESTGSEELPPLPRSVTYKITDKVYGRDSGTYEVVQLGAGRSRQTSKGDVVSVSNQGTTIEFNHRAKEATIFQHPEEFYEELGILGYYRKLLTDPGYKPQVKREMLGESDIDGRRVVGHRIIKPGQVTRIWVDPQSLLPVQIEKKSRMEPPNEIRIESGFVFNVDLDESLFSVEPPAGYTVDRRPMEKESYEENDLIETFREWREQGHSMFPYALERDDFAKMPSKKFPALGENPTPEQFEQLLDWAAKAVRGFEFVDRLPQEADAHYAGKHVKVDATDTPIFWYKPEGKGKYRVIRADLSVIETDTPPQIPGAQSISDWGREQLASRHPWRKPSPLSDPVSYIREKVLAHKGQRSYSPTAKRDLKFIDELSSTFGNTQGERVEVATLGNVDTSEGVFPMRMFVVNKDAESAKVLLVGAVHGDEPGGAYTLASMLRRHGELVNRFPGVCFHMIPVVNPWGFVHDQRPNEGGIDIVCDFTLRESSEATIIHGEIEKHKYDLAIELHEGSGTANWICVRTLKDVEMFTPLVKSLERSGHELARSPTSRFFRGLANEKGISYIPGSVSHLLLRAERETLPFLLTRKGVPAFVIETGKRNELDQRIDFAEKAIYAMVEEYTGEQQ
ncbi:MAG: hypothetical protein ACYTG0_26380 [Planctomycetota bacterium]